MTDTFDNQKEVLVALKNEINLLRQQVDFLIRNEKELGLLDLDVMMNRTHTIYDMLCSVNFNNQDEEETGMDADQLMSNLFGTMANTEETNQQEQEVPEEQDTEEPEPEPEEKTEPITKAEDEPGFSFRLEDEPEPEKEAPQQEEIKAQAPYVATEEPAEEPADEEIQDPVAQGGDTYDDDEENAYDESPEIHDEEQKTAVGFHVEHQPNVQIAKPEHKEVALTPETTILADTKPEQEVLGEKMQQQEDNSLAARLQKKPVYDLKTAIGINDKFLFVNELFSGSMEKYNKSIGNLNDLKTLNGALIYLNELKIELQWNSNNEAYRKLSNLISRKFGN